MSWMKWLGGAIAVVVGIYALWTVTFRDTTTPVTRDDISTSVPGDASTTPGDPGVYAFVTSGFEEIDALGGARHDYPAETFVTIRAEDCGFVTRWDALLERWTEWKFCSTDAGLALDVLTSFHRWYGQTNLEPYPCEGAPLLVPALAEPDETSFTCTKDETVETYRLEVIGNETVTVAGEDLATVHVRLTSSIDGTTVGTAVLDQWWLAGTPLPVRFVVDRDNVTESAVGKVHYTEHFEIDLASPYPEG